MALLCGERLRALDRFLGFDGEFVEAEGHGIVSPWSVVSC
jgi:hypothetical protein